MSLSSTTICSCLQQLPQSKQSSFAQTGVGRFLCTTASTSALERFRRVLTCSAKRGVLALVVAEVAPDARKLADQAVVVSHRPFFASSSSPARVESLDGGLRLRQVFRPHLRELDAVRRDRRLGHLRLHRRDLLFGGVDRLLDLLQLLALARAQGVLDRRGF